MEYYEPFFKIFAQPITLILLFIAGAIHWYRQKEKELALEKQKLDYQKTLDRNQLEYDNNHNALKATWGLLRYFSKIPSEDSVMYVVGKDYHFRPQQAQSFIKAVEKVFFEQAHGLYLPSKVKKPLFEIRDAIDKLAYTSVQKEGEFIIDATVGKMIYQNRNALNKVLRESV